MDKDPKIKGKIYEIIGSELNEAWDDFMIELTDYAVKYAEDILEDAIERATDTIIKKIEGGEIWTDFVSKNKSKKR